MTATPTAAQIAKADAAQAAADRYGFATSTLTAGTIAAREAIDYRAAPTWVGDKNLTKITVVRLIGFGDYGFPFVELSYCYGELADGTPVRVDLGRHQFSKRAWKSELIACFKDAGRYGKGMGVDVNDPYSVSRI